MDGQTFDRLTHLFDRVGSRRAAFGALLGAAVLGTASTATVAKPEPPGYGKPGRSSARRGENRGDGNDRLRAQAKRKPGNHCTTPFGLDLNEFFGISARIVTGFCGEVGFGERWMTSGVWFVGDTFAVVPEGFVPAGETPVEDFLAKFAALKFVIDPGTRQERTAVFPNTGNVFTGAGDAFPGIPADWTLVAPVTLGTVQPLAVGDHVVDIY